MMANNYELVDVGLVSSWVNQNYTLPDSGRTIEGKTFINDLIDLSGCEISFNGFKPGQYLPFNHKHTHHEETYIFLSGEGECDIDGEIMAVKEGTVINILPQAIRSLCNTSKDQDLNFIVIQTHQNSMTTTKRTEDGVVTSIRERW